MRNSAGKLFIISLGILLLAGGAAAYVWHEQERYGRSIKEGVMSLKAWEATRPGAEGEERSESAAKLGRLVLDSESDAVRFLAYVEDLAKQVGVETAATGLKVVKTKESGFDELSASFAIKGDVRLVEKMIELLELLPYRSRIESLSLSRQTDVAEASVTVLVSVRE